MHQHMVTDAIAFGIEGLEHTQRPFVHMTCDATLVFDIEYLGPRS